MWQIRWISVVIQQYEAEVNNQYVIRGNSAIMKCEIPSYVSDFIMVDMWVDSDGGSYHPNPEQYGTSSRFFAFWIAFFMSTVYGFHSTFRSHFLFTHTKLLL